jgi:transposase
MWFDRNGYCILYKRLHGALFRLPSPTDPLRPVAQIDGRKLAELLTGVAKEPRRRKKP